MRSILLLCVLLLAGCPSPKPEKVPENPQAKPFDHAPLTALLREHVDDKGRVDYVGLLADRKKLRSYLDQLADADWKKLKDRAARFAFWINAYNACCLEGVLQTLPADRARWGEYSVEDVSGFFGSRTYRVSGQLVTLDDIEHKTLRVQFADARLHFAIVCASVGCPLLRREAFVAGRLDQQLDEQARQFVGNPEKVRFDLEAREMKISKIFSWFEKDFLQESGSVARFLARYVSDGRLAESLRSQPWSIGYLDYDWDLNLKR